MTAVRKSLSFTATGPRLETPFGTPVAASVGLDGREFSGPWLPRGGFWFCLLKAIRFAGSSIPRNKLLRSAFCTIRQAIGQDAYLPGCGAPFESVYGTGLLDWPAGGRTARATAAALRPGAGVPQSAVVDHGKP
jgi:hypothetical protein